MKIKQILFSLSFAAIALPANAMLIVDTGAGASGQPGGISVYRDDQLDDYQYVAGQFTLTQDWIITGVQSWMSALGGEDGTIAIYSESNDAPNQELFSSEFLAVGGYDTEWEGNTELNWFLPAGTYYASFEVREGQNMDAYIAEGAASPLDQYSFFNPANSDWIDLSLSEAFGFRIEAMAPVPVPAALPLFLTALLALGRIRRKQVSRN